MITLILFILIGIKLEMMNGLYLALVIMYTIWWIIELILKIIKFGLKGFRD